MSAKKLLALWGLKWNPFTPELPGDALLVTAKIESFAWRVEQLVQEGGFALISGESGTGKSVALRIVAQRLSTLRDVVVGAVERPQSKNADFYRELGDIFSVKVRPSNRWGGFHMIHTLKINKAKILSPSLAKKDMFIYLHKKHKALIPKLSQALTEIKENGVYGELVKKHLTPLLHTHK